MTLTRRSFLAAVSTVFHASFADLLGQESKGAGPLPSWNEGPVKRAILDFVERTTRVGSPDFVPVANRIAAFDNDGTLWCEQPMYVQLRFALDRVKTLAPMHPNWSVLEPFKSVLDGELTRTAAGGEKMLAELIIATHSGMTTEEFEAIVTDWMRRARHPRFDRPYPELVYQPMLEVLHFLQQNGYRSHIVSGGGIEFMRPWTTPVYGIPPERIVGSSVKNRYELRDDKPVLIRLAEMDFIDDKAGKPVAISKFMGQRPIMTFGNSDGDYEMLRYVTAGNGPRFGLIVHHTDAKREYAYDRKSVYGRLDRALDEAPKRGWFLADMKNDWRRIFPFEA